MGEARILKKGDLVKVVKVKGKDPLILSELRLIDVRWTKIGFSGFQVLREFFKLCFADSKMRFIKQTFSCRAILQTMIL